MTDRFRTLPPSDGDLGLHSLPALGDSPDHVPVALQVMLENLAWHAERYGVVLPYVLNELAGP